MRHKGLLIVLVFLLFIIVAGGLAWSRFSLSALNPPGPVENYVASKAKRWLVARSVGGPLPPAPANDETSIAIGGMQFRGECATCHGTDGRTPSDIGKWMYPRALDLGSPEVRQWSDAELFWIIKNGIRFTGMPGFGKIHSDEQIWHLVHYVRAIGAPAR